MDSNRWSYQNDMLGEMTGEFGYQFGVGQYE